MTPVIPCSVSSIPFIPGSAFTRRNRCYTRHDFAGKIKRGNLTSCRIIPLPSIPVRVFPQFSGGYAQHYISRLHRLSAAGTNLEVVEQESPTLEDSSTGPPLEPSIPVEAREHSSTLSGSEAASTRSKRSRPARRSQIPPVTNEDLVPGATFIGRVVSILEFGAFVDIGAFRNGLVHKSRLSDDFVNDVSDFVSLGQEVKVRLVEVNTESGRISLSMRENDDSSKAQARKDAAATSQKSRPARNKTSKANQKKEAGKKSFKYVGQHLVGTVKNLTRSGAFVSLPEGEVGFLPASEESHAGMGIIRSGSSLEVGQEVDVRVLRVTSSQVTLTMKKELEEFGTETIQGALQAATNPFVLAFHQNESIASFLDERTKLEETAQSVTTPETPDNAEQIEILAETETATPDLLGQSAAGNDNIAAVPTALDNDNILIPVENDAKDVLVNDEVEIPTPTPEKDNPSAPLTANEDSQEIVASQEIVMSTSNGDTIAEQEVVQTSREVIDLLSVVPAEELLVTPIPQQNGSIIGGNLEVSEVSSSGSLAEEVAGNADPSGNAASSEIFSSQNQRDEENPEKPAETDELDDHLQIQAASTETEVSSVTLISNQNDGSRFDKTGDIPNTNGPSAIQSSDESSAKAIISPALVKQLREETGAGMMDCKKALSEMGGDIVKAQEYLRKKGLSSAEKKAGRTTAEGRIGSYIHDSRIGVLIEVNCETDFVSRGEIFEELVDDLAMQVAACPQVDYLVTEDIPNEIVAKEKDIEMQKEDLLSKPEQIREKIVEGRIHKRLAGLALLEQPFIKNDKILVKDWVKQTIATIGENIKVKRFVRYNLGEGLEKKSQDFVAEVAAQTAMKTSSAPSKELAATTEAPKSEEKRSSVTVSASLVKQLREETGAGMMDCKKALTETGGDLENAQEYLRKKGLSTADKKSSRLAAEGRIGSYIHASRIGVLIEVNSETDFVARGENFKSLVDDLAMQVVACPQVKFVSIEDIPEEIVRKEKEIEMQREDILSKPENIRHRIVDGRVSKRLGELALLEQPFIKDDNVLVKDLVKQTVAALGENIKVRRFVRFTLGEEPEDSKAEMKA
ncbi:hypothetical protein Dimus_030810 [Dionaea muscipula]